MKFTIYGSGCAKCRQLTENTEQAANQKGISYELVKVTDTNDIIDAGIMRTPALAIDDEIVLEGKVASVDQVSSLLG